MGIDGWELAVRVIEVDDDRDEIPELLRRLRSALDDLDVDAVELLADTAPDEAKAGSGLAATLGVRLGAAALGTVVGKIREWIARNGRSVEITMDGDTLKLTGASPAQQEQLLGVWLARHAPHA